MRIIDIYGKTSQRDDRAPGGAPRTLGKEIVKGARRMPRLQEATKDVASCEKPRGSAHTN